MGALADLREANRLRIVDELRRRGNATRGELAAATGLSRTTVTTLVAEMQAHGLVVEDGAAREDDARPGRPAALLRLEEAAGAALGVDFGHSHVRVAVADLCNALNRDAIVVGGDLSRAGDALVAGIRDAVDRRALPAAAGAVTVSAGALGERAEVLGALTLVAGDGGSLNGYGRRLSEMVLTAGPPAA